MNNAYAMSASFEARKNTQATMITAGFAGLLRDDAYTDLEHLTQALLGAVNDAVQPTHAFLHLRNSSVAASELRPALVHHASDRLANQEVQP